MSEFGGIWKRDNYNQHMHLYPQRRNVAAQVAEGLETVTCATPPMEELWKKIIVFAEKHEAWPWFSESRVPSIQVLWDWQWKGHSVQDSQATGAGWTGQANTHTHTHTHIHTHEAVVQSLQMSTADNWPVKALLMNTASSVEMSGILIAPFPQTAWKLTQSVASSHVSVTRSDKRVTKSKKQRWLLAFNETNHNTQEVKMNAI